LHLLSILTGQCGKIEAPADLGEVFLISQPDRLGKGWLKSQRFALQYIQ
jgi:hypothetical protein